MTDLRTAIAVALRDAASVKLSVANQVPTWEEIGADSRKYWLDQADTMLGVIPKAVRDVAAERATHEGRGWTAEHDRRHHVHHLVQLAEQYAHKQGPVAEEAGVYDRKYLVKAASLLVAAIELLDSLPEEG